MNFSEALEAVKAGKAVRRDGWNGKGMFIYLVKGSVDSSDRIRTQVDKIPSFLFDSGDRGTATRLPHIAIRTVTGSTGVWSASAHDILANDWEIAQ